MTGGAFFPAPSGADEEYELDESGVERHAVQWVGTPSIKGPKWAKVPLLTIGMLGIQCVWSIEMGYASPYLLELGLSKSWMSLVFVAGPLSGLIVQPLIGAYADRCQSRFGRRRPFMVAGVAICVFSMMLLGWSREVGSIFTSTSTSGKNYLAIALAVAAIYLIDFSVNALMSTDRALVVDTLTQSQQEEGSAWAGRMFGFGSLAGFFVGNLDLTNVLPFFGKTQLQILSFVTGLIMTVSHSLTSWAVSERVLLRDDRAQSSAGLVTSIKAIWDNIFTLPSGIRSICIIQFCANLAWYPILFFTSIWAADIYKKSVPQGSLSDAEWEADAVRSGARALFLQAVVNIITSLGAPFLVSSSGIGSFEDHSYTSLTNGNGYERGGDDDHDDIPTSAQWKRSQELSLRSGLIGRVKSGILTLMASMKDGSAWVLPIKWLTLVRLWCLAQIVFAAAMVVSWFVTSSHGVYMVIAMTGFSWALQQWAPYALLGELVLIDTAGSGRSNQSHQMNSLRNSSDRDGYGHRSPTPAPTYASTPVPPLSSEFEAQPQIGLSTPSLHSRHASRTSLALSRVTTTSDEEYHPSPHPYHSPHPPTHGLSTPHKTPGSNASRVASPLVLDVDRTTVVLRHSGEDSDDEDDLVAVDGSQAVFARHLSSGPASPMSPGFARDDSTPPQGFTQGPSSSTSGGQAGAGQSTADKAGLILGIHNVFIVMPQFIITLLSAIIFYLMEPGKSLPATHPNTNTGTTAGANATTMAAVVEVVGEVGVRTVRAVVEREAEGNTSPDTVGLIFRVGGVAAAVGAFITYRLGRDWARGRGVV